MPPDTGQEGGVRQQVDGPLFISEYDGRVSTDVFDLARSRRFCLAKLAPSFANPWLEEEIRPECPWEGVRRFMPRPALPPLGSSDLTELVPRFRAAVGTAIGDAATVLVLYSGGLDSTAVLT